MRLNITRATVSLAVKSVRYHACIEAIIVGFLNGCCVIGLLGRVAVFWTLIRNRKDNFRGIGVPAVVIKCWGVSRDVSEGVFPRETSPVGAWSPVLTRISRIGVPVVNCVRESTKPTRVVAGCLAQRCGARSSILVVSLAITAAGGTWESISQAVNRLVDCNVAVVKHRFYSLEITTARKIAAVH